MSKTIIYKVQTNIYNLIVLQKQRCYVLLYTQWISAIYNHFNGTNMQCFGLRRIHNKSVEVKKSGKGSHCSLKIIFHHFVPVVLMSHTWQFTWGPPECFCFVVTQRRDVLLERERWLQVLQHCACTLDKWQRPSQRRV